MDQKMLDKLRLVEEKYIEIGARTEQPDFFADPKKAAAYLKEQKDLAPVVEVYRGYLRAQQDMADALELMTGQTDPEMKELCQEEYADAKNRCAQLEEDLKILLLPKDPNDDKSVIVEIRGGVGGEESALFAHSLFRMYQLYAASRNWSVQLLNYTETELGGVKEADFEIRGAGAVPPVPVVSTSIRPPPLFAFSTSPQALSLPARKNEANSRIAKNV